MQDSEDLNNEIQEEPVYESDNDQSDLEKTRKKLEECRQEKEKYLDGWQRAQADFINYRRRNEEQMAHWSKMFGEGLIKDILPVLDSLGAALGPHPDDKGMVLLKNQLQSILKKHGLKEIESIGEKFNPEIHEAVECEEAGGREDEIVTEEIQKGYMLNGKVLRIAKVKTKK